LYDKVLEIRHDAFGENYPDYADTLISLAAIYAPTHNLDKALLNMKQSANIYKNFIGQIFHGVHILDVIHHAYN
jgi:tetratricopeptide repeat protein